MTNHHHIQLVPFYPPSTLDRHYKAIERDEGRKPYSVMRIFLFLAEQFGRRPALLAGWVLLSGAWLTWALYETFEAAGEARVFVLLAALIWGILIWRLRSTDKYLRSVLRNFYRRAADNREEKKRLRLIAEELRIDERTQHRLFRLVRWLPDVFLTLVLMLNAIAGLLWVAVHYWIPLPDLARWCALLLSVFYFILNDIWIGERLVAFVVKLPCGQASPPTPEQAFLQEQHRQRFAQKLSRRQREIFNLRYEQGKSLKEIQQEKYISLSTVKTHVNDVNKIWKIYMEEQQLSGWNLWDFYSQKTDNQ